MITCDDVRERAAEAALDLLSGDARADVLTHLDSCDDCRELVRELSVASDRLVLLSPEAEPPLGFEQRVLTRFPPARRRRRWPVAAAAAAAALLLVVGVALGRAGRDQLNVREVVMRTPSGSVVGDAYLHGEDPSWMLVAVPGWTDASPDYTVRVTMTDGTRLEFPGGDLATGHGAWGTSLPVSTDTVHEIALVGGDGRVWCSASL